MMDKQKPLESRQYSLYKKLEEKSPKLARIYRGALHVMLDDSNPDRLALSAHNLRELMEKFPEYADIRIRPQESLGSKVNNLEQKWNRVVRSSHCKQDVTWCGEIDKELKGLLLELELFFNWKKQNMSSRKDKVNEVLNAMDGGNRRLPDKLEELRAKFWKEINSFFQAVSHHGKEITEDEFRRYLEALEEFIIERIEPRTYEVFDELDSIIAAGGEQGAN